MKITVVGTGYVGLVAGTCLADLGNEVICVDVDKDKISKLNKGIIPIFEPGLKDLLDRNVREKRLFFTTDIKKGVQESLVIFIAVGTPEGKDNKADLKYVWQVAADIGKYMNEYKVIVDKSTVPVGTADKVKKLIRENQKKAIDFDIVSNPEFLREGEAIGDFTFPDRIVIGVESKRAEEVMTQIYKGITRSGKPLIVTDIKSSELIKYASNAMLATRISFMNEIANLCEKVGADVKKVAYGIGLDSRIGPRFLQAGIGYGGSCFPKDVQALIKTGEENNSGFKILDAVEEVNEQQKLSIIPKIKKLLPELKNKTIAVWGLAFKPKTDDMREAPSIILINELNKAGAKIQAFDPEAENTAKKIFSHVKNLSYANTPYDALKNADVLVIATEWNVFRDLDKEKMKNLLKHPNIIDGRNVYEPEEMRKLGFNYIGVGR
ncbi:UDP-glucose/GDP-mannose dehydrogenase family protein [Candidatus Woesearchaeota archaeon]|nr:UDP-glucose/GDP-mannose dehydrogenase family protein [Candidatus Woesearchaeota archaeon]